jgi:hypothetical protein
VNTTRYFGDQVLRKRPYLTVYMCAAVIAAPLAKLVQEDGRVRHWGSVTLPNEA